MRIATVPLLAAFAAPLLAAGHAGHGDHGAPARAAPAIASRSALVVTTVPGEAPTVSAIVVAAAAPLRRQRIAAPIAGSLAPPDSGFPAPGERVREGQLLAWIVPQTRAVESARLDADKAEAQRDKSVAELQIQQIVRGFGGGTMSMETGPSMKPRLDLQVQGADARLAVLGDGRNARQPVRASVSGRISDGVDLARISRGLAVPAGAALFEIADPDALWFDLSARSEALPAEARAVDGDGRLWRLRRIAVSPTVVGGVRQARYAVDGGSQGVRPGDRLHLRLREATDTAALGAGWQPPAGTPLQRDAAGHGWLWVHAGAARAVPRAVAIDSDGRITDGLLPGERVVVTGIVPAAPAAEPRVAD